MLAASFILVNKYLFFRMIVRPALSTLKRGVTQDFVARCFSLNMPALAKAADPVQQLFVDKIREYAQKSKYVYENCNFFNQLSIY